MPLRSAWGGNGCDLETVSYRFSGNGCDLETVSYRFSGNGCDPGRRGGAGEGPGGDDAAGIGWTA